tara:strand:+ start:647 stop:871 length:225 start_codon:yes stop_codon:yes gene_type:complete
MNEHVNERKKREREKIHGHDTMFVLWILGELLERAKARVHDLLLLRHATLLAHPLQSIDECCDTTLLDNDVDVA